MKDLIVKIQIAEVDSEIVCEWVSKFNLGSVLRRADAFLDGQTLVVNAHDISIFIEASNCEGSGLMAIHRLKKSAIRALESTLNRRTNVLVKRSLESAKAMLIESSPSSSGYEEKMLKPRVMEKLPHV